MERVRNVACDSFEHLLLSCSKQLFVFAEVFFFTCSYTGTCLLTAMILKKLIAFSGTQT